jgi:hypothetical protein
MTPFLWKLVLRCLSVGFLATHDRSAFEKQNFTRDTLEIQALYSGEGLIHLTRGRLHTPYERAT